jgi:hypothetical protein
MQSRLKVDQEELRPIISAKTRQIICSQEIKNNFFLLRDSRAVKATQTIRTFLRTKQKDKK